MGRGGGKRSCKGACSFLKQLVLLENDLLAKKKGVFGGKLAEQAGL